MPVGTGNSRRGDRVPLFSLLPGTRTHTVLGVTLRQVGFWADSCAANKLLSSALKGVHGTLSHPLAVAHFPVLPVAFDR